MNGYPYSPSQLGVRPNAALSNQLLAGAFTWMFAGLLLTAGIAWFVASNEALTNTLARLLLPLFVGQLILAVAIQGLIPKMSPMTALVGFFIYAATLGLSIGVIVTAYTGESVAAAFFTAGAMFGGAAIYGATTKRSLAGWGGTLSMAVIGLFVAMIVNYFLDSSPLGWLLSLIGVGLFTVLTAFDVQRIAHGDYAAWLGSVEKASVLAALHLYINFINIFLFLLRLMGSRD